MQNHNSQLSIRLYPQKLVIVSIDRNRFNEYTYELLKYFIDKNKPFFSLTISKNEISLVTEEESAKNFIDCNKKEGWYALHVSVGASNTEGDLVMLTSSVLKDANIPIFYNSSFNDDIILVEETNITKALLSLSNHFSIEIEVDGKDESAEQFISKHKSKEKTNITPDIEMKDNGSYSLRVLPSELIFLNFKVEELKMYMQSILQLIFYTCHKNNNRFINCTQIENEISILLDRQSYNEVFEESQNQQLSMINYKAIKRYGKKGFKEIGVINYLSKQLVQNNLRVLYLSTFMDAFMLVQANDFSCAFNLLKNQENIDIEYEEDN